VQGPRARETIALLFEGVDLSNSAMPHMSLREARISGVPARLMRVSFTGELGYEINVPSHFGRAFWEAAWREVQKHEGCVYGTEAMHVMRAEKGYVIVGQETDGTVTLADLGLDWAIGKTKKDFVGKRSLTRPDMLAANRKQLVGLLTDNPAIQLEEGAQVTETANPPIGSSALGHVTSSYRSQAVGRPIALALVAAGRSRMGAKLHIPTPSGAVSVTVVSPVFYDKEGARLSG
jgi:sarcosine oxidase, subunit alpha